ncbi:tRNA pseudouridine(55) synthase TruB [Xenococcus sp. PCC 7305]|uniref:tRNA pseudouridine(55) synthase TruB n=1 Tax=Xenococcus sp. PCC 7305 TaxID=102125 RepID=UPI0005945F23|nr:tRNA pseudouridine(55) synthase TruB [Xenococcus sp. PCC 7305]
MFGFINLYKPTGFTSHDCVSKIRRLIDMKKVGHGGTLDPLATGVLPIAVGKATRLLQFLPETKVYRAVIRLGMSTSTDDLEGEIINTKSALHIRQEKIVPYLDNFQGQIEQIPPMYSAIKKGGKKLYELARKGESVEVPPRIVTIYQIKILNFLPGEYPEVEVEISCSPGTYIRAIARDLGTMLGVGGTLANLIRIESCGMRLENSIDFDRIDQQIQQNSFTLIEPDSLLSHLKSVTLNPDNAKRWCYGQTIPLAEENCENSNFETSAQDIYLGMYQEENIFLGIGLLKNSEGILVSKPKVVC